MDFQNDRANISREFYTPATGRVTLVAGVLDMKTYVKSKTTAISIMLSQGF